MNIVTFNFRRRNKEKCKKKVVAQIEVSANRDTINSVEYIFRGIGATINILLI